jgi:hypothetical protein
MSANPSKRQIAVPAALGACRLMVPSATVANRSGVAFQPALTLSTATFGCAHTSPKSRFNFGITARLSSKKTSPSLISLVAKIARTASCPTAFKIT